MEKICEGFEVMNAWNMHKITYNDNVEGVLSLKNGCLKKRSRGNNGNSSLEKKEMIPRIFFRESFLGSEFEKENSGAQN